jgi:hypothetical protein
MALSSWQPLRMVASNRKGRCDAQGRPHQDQLVPLGVDNLRLHQLPASPRAPRPASPPTRLSLSSVVQLPTVSSPKVKRSPSSAHTTAASSFRCSNHLLPHHHHDQPQHTLVLFPSVANHPSQLPFFQRNPGGNTRAQAHQLATLPLPTRECAAQVTLSATSSLLGLASRAFFVCVLLTAAAASACFTSSSLNRTDPRTRTPCPEHASSCPIERQK